MKNIIISMLLVFCVLTISFCDEFVEDEGSPAESGTYWKCVYGVDAYIITTAKEYNWMYNLKGDKKVTNDFIYECAYDSSKYRDFDYTGHYEKRVRCKTTAFQADEHVQCETCSVRYPIWTY